MNSDISIIKPEEYSESLQYQLEVSYKNLSEHIDALISIVKNSPEFNKLADNTQMIFMEKGCTKVQNRQTHTLMVAEISEKLAKKDGMTEVEQKLAYFIGLCHDLGHTALGHDGESRINAALQHYNMDSAQFSKRFYEDLSKLKGEELSNNQKSTVFMKISEYSFEHHAHSVRVLGKILRENKVYIDEALFGDIYHGILCHSESRTKDKDVEKPLWALARYADKIYPYTDMQDLLNCNVNISNIITEINRAGGQYTEEREFTKEDARIFREIVTNLRRPNGLNTYINKYVEGATMEASEGRFIYTASEEVKRERKILKTVATFLRQERVGVKEGKVARAMVDEIIRYGVERLDDGKTLQDKLYKMAMVVANATDTSLRGLYKDICQDKAWCEIVKEDDKDFEAGNEEFPIKLPREVREKVRENPNYIIQVEAKRQKIELMH